MEVMRMSKEIMKEIEGNWNYERCVKPEHVDFLIKRVQELEELNSMRIKDIDFTNETLGKARKQNERYREAFGRITQSEIEDARKFSDFAEQIAWRALEGYE